ncbi:MAG: FecR domain-containing protein [Acidiferrobacterales bacterium]
MVSRVHRPTFPASLVFLALMWSLPLHAAIAPAGQVVMTNGPFVALQADGSARSLSRNSEFYEGDRLWTGPRTKAQVRFTDGAIMTLRPDTEFSVDEYEFNEKDAGRNKSLFTLVKGGFRTLTGLITRLRPEAYRVKTSYAIVGVRGTTYETVLDRGLYVAAWQGTISVENEADELVLGFGQDYNYARVTSFTRAPAGLVQPPPQLQQSVDPQLQEAMIDPTETRLVTGLLQDGADGRLTPAELASLDRDGFATFGGVNSQTTLSGIASDGGGGSPILFDVSADVVLRKAGAPLSGFFTPNPDNTIAGISWGVWDGTVSPATTQRAIDPTPVPVDREVFWMTMLPSTTLPTGTASYFTVVSSGGTGNLGGPGAATVPAFSATVNFGTATLNGSMTVVDAGNTWGTSFTGNVSGARFNANLNPAASLINGNPARQATGDIIGGFSGPNAQSMGGVFDFEEIGTSTTYVNGAFVAQ